MAEPLIRAGRSHAARTPGMGDSRPPFPPAPIRFLLLAGAILTVLLGGLFMAHPAGAATLTPAAHAVIAPTTPASLAPTTPAPLAPTTPAPLAPTTPAPAARSGAAAHTAIIPPAKLDSLVERDGGVCSVPGIGDIGGLLGLCHGGSSGVVGELNNICTPSVPQPEQATSGVDSMIATPGGQTGGKTLYDNYGLAGQYWAAYGLHCSDMTSLIGNNVAGMVFDMAKSLDRVTITVYQTAAGNGILTWLQNAVNKLITALGKAIYFPFLAPVVIIGAIWLAWQGLIRKRATRTIEGTLWMVIACAAAIWLIGRPADFTGVGSTVSNSVTQVMNVAFAKLPAPTGSNCLPVGSTDPQSVTANYAFTSANGLVDQNANELWAVLVCKPWLDGELGTTQYGKTPPNVVDNFGRSLLWAQAIAANEQPTTAMVASKQQVYVGIAKQLQASDPAVYPLFQGNQWTTRLEIGFEALFASVAAGLLVLLIALTLIVLKLGFLLLLVAGPFFLIVGVHPGFGRVIAIRWFEMLIGVLMKQIAVALVLSVLLYCYSLIMGTTDTALPWALKIMMIALVTVAVFIYRKPFQHLFSSVGYGVLGSTDRAEYSWREASYGFRRATATAAGVGAVALPGYAAYRAARWARRNPGTAETVATGGAAAGAAAMAGATGEDAAAGAGPGAPGAPGTRPTLGGVPAADGHTAGRLRPGGPPPGGDDNGQGGGSDGSGDPGGSGGQGGAPAGRGGRGRQWPEAGGGTGRAAPPLPLPPTGGGSSSEGGSAGWARGSAARAGTTSGRSASSAPAPGPAGNGGSSGSAATPSPPPPVRRSARPAGNGSAGSGSASSSPAGGGPAAGGPAAGWPSGNGPFGGRQAGNGPFRGRQAVGRSAGSGSAGSGSAGSGSAGSGSAGSGSAGNGSAGNGSAGNRSAGNRPVSGGSRGSVPGNPAGGGSGRTSRPAGGSGWLGGDATVRSGEKDGTGAAGKRPPLPFWLRPVRRDK